MVRTIAVMGAKSFQDAPIGEEEKEAFTFELRRLHDINQRKNVQILNAFLLRPAPEIPGAFVIIASAEEEGKLEPGSPYVPGREAQLAEHQKDLWVPEKPISGMYLGYAPILNKQGEYVATFGVHLSGVPMHAEINRLKQILLFAIGVALLLGLIAAAFLSYTVSSSLRKVMRWIREIKKGDLEARVDVKTRDEFGTLAEALNQMAETLEEHQELKTHFARYVSHHVMEKILHTKKTPMLEGETRRITVLFADIRNFSRFAEKLEPEEVLATLNEFFEAMIEIIFDNEGTHDKFTGDGLMAEFGAPLEDPKQEEHAYKAAVGMLAALDRLNQDWECQGRKPLEMGIGIHTGKAVVGNIGSSRRMEYTAIGDTVNVAARLEKVSKELGVSILLSAATVKGIEKKGGIRPLGLVPILGREEGIEVFGTSGD